MDHNFTATVDVISSSILASLLAIEILASLLANTAVLVTTAVSQRGRESWKLSSTILFNFLILSHFVISITYSPLTIGGFLAREWTYGSTFEQKLATCKFAGYMLVFSFLIVSMTLALISFDRCLFITKPQTHKRLMGPRIAVSLVLGVWLLAALLTSTPLYGFGEFGYEPSYGYCGPLWIQIGFVVYAGIVSTGIVGVIFITSIWTLCFTHKFLKDHSASEEGVYSSRKKRLFGIFGTMIIVYIVCLLPAIGNALITPIVVVPELFLTGLVCFQLITIASPLVQSYFRPDIKKALISLYKKIFSGSGFPTKNSRESDLTAL